MRIADLPDNGEVATSKSSKRHKDVGRGVEVGLATDTGIQQVAFPSACDWMVVDRGLLAIKDESGDEIGHIASGHWVYVTHPGVISVL